MVTPDWAVKAIEDCRAKYPNLIAIEYEESTNQVVFIGEFNGKIEGRWVEEGDTVEQEKE